MTNNNTPKRSGLMTQELLNRLPKLYSQEAVEDPVAIAKFFTPDSSWSWYPVEFDGDDLFFGLVIGFERELGYFLLSELESCRGPLGLSIERDLHFVPMPISKIVR